jgi:hypothetical protein
MTKTPHTFLRIAVLAVIAGGAAPAHAQTQVASFASVVGAVEVQRAKGEWLAASIGSPVFEGDSVRTAANAFGKLAFTDDVVVDLGSSTLVSIERYAGAKGPRRSLLRLNAGAMEAWVGGYSGEARWEVETPTAVVRVQGTDFIVRYDATAKATDVVGVDGTVGVQGTTGIIGPAVVVGANEMSHVPSDGFPSPVKPVDPAQANEFAQGLRRIGTGTRDSLDVDNAIADGRTVAPRDRPPVGGVVAAAAEDIYLHPDVPGQTLVQTLSPDIRANNQPLPQYRVVPPNESPNPPH